jgi:peptidyl-prolyl cis-trans isomerase NIMA-interacting 1
MIPRVEAAKRAEKHACSTEVVRDMSRASVFASFSILLVASAGASMQCGGSAPAAADPASTAKSTADACLAVARTKRSQSPADPVQIRAMHVLVQYQGAKTAKMHIVRFRDEACLRAMEARDELRAGTDVAGVVNKYSDEPGAEARAGSLGTIERKDVVPTFADAAFGLLPGEISEVVETEFGFHVIMRLE